MEQLFTLLLGWLLGLLSPGIAERIRRSYRIKDVTNALIAELNEVKYNLALTAYLLCGRLAMLDNEALDWMVGVISTYTGPVADPRMAEAIKAIRAIAEPDRLRLYSVRVDSGCGLSLKTIPLPLLDAHLAEISLFPVPFQAMIMRIKGQIDVYNQHVESLQRQFEMTFTVTDNSNNQALRGNQVEGFRALAGMAKMAATLIGRLESENAK